MKNLREEIELFVSSSSFLLEELNRRGVTFKRSVVIPVGVASIGNHRSRSFGVNLRFGYLGNITPKKGIEVLVEAFRGSLARSLVIRGFPDEKSILNFRASFPGCAAKLELFSSDVESFYEKVDVLVVPSIWYENQPTVILESFQHRKPVICSDIGGMSEMVEHGVSGLLFRAADAKDLREKVVYLRDNPSVVVTLAKGIPKWFTIQEQSDRLLEVYSSLL